MPINASEIVDSILSLDANKSVSRNNIPSFFLKSVSYVLVPHLCYIYLFNLAFANAMFPDNCRIRKIIPIHKKGWKKQPKLL